MKIASILIVMIAGGLTFLGLWPCVGWLNWVAVPMNCAAIIIGLIGLGTDRGEQGDARGVPMHLIAVIAGALFLGVSILRCLLGGGAA